MIGFFILILAVSASIAWLWAGGIDYMHRNHPDYKGEDFLHWDFDEQDKEQIL
jgi:lipopolysaccharide export system protein LptC